MRISPQDPTSPPSAPPAGAKIHIEEGGRREGQIWCAMLELLVHSAVDKGEGGSTRVTVCRTRRPPLRAHHPPPQLPCAALLLLYSAARPSSSLTWHCFPHLRPAPPLPTGRRRLTATSISRTAHGDGLTGGSEARGWTGAGVGVSSSSPARGGELKEERREGRESREERDGGAR